MRRALRRITRGGRFGPGALLPVATVIALSPPAFAQVPDRDELPPQETPAREAPPTERDPTERDPTERDPTERDPTERDPTEEGSTEKAPTETEDPPKSAPPDDPAAEVTPDEESSADEQRGTPTDPRDEAIFGGSEDAAPSETDQDRDAAIFGQGGDSENAPPAAADLGGTERDQAILGDPGGAIEFADDVAPDDPLTLGGLLYLRTQSFILEEQDPEDWSLTAPTLAQLYFDIRPNDRVRGYVLGRLQYDPTLPPIPEPLLGVGGPIAPGASTNGTLPLNSIFLTGTRDPRVALDQLWVNFDVARFAFVTVGRQHVRWGTGRFWMPTDYLHLTNRNPIDVFDSRTGTNMLKVQIPIEELAWNFYGFLVYEDATEATNTLSRVAGAARGEFVFGTSEFGLGVYARRGSGARYAADVSFGVWDVDIYGEVAVRDAEDIDRVRFDPDTPLPPPEPPPSWQSPTEVALDQLRRAVDTRYPVFQEDGLRPQVVTGVEYARNYDDDDVFRLGAEYFYNSLGYDSPQDYPGLILPHTEPLRNPATFFYLGEHYGAVYASFPSPFSLDLHTFTFSTLGNLSDQSFISRIDYSYILLTHLTLEAFAAVHYGPSEGEFRFGVDNAQIGDLTLDQPPALIDLGLALRLEF